MNKTKFDWNGYWRPTPRLFRQLGDALLATTTGISIPEILLGHKAVAVTLLIVGSAGKFMSNFFKEKDDVQP